MPGGNRTGPEGAGAKTGRGLGYCGGSQTPGSETTGRRGVGGRGRGGGGRGRGGRGRRNVFHTTGLTGWQRVVADQQAVDEPGVPLPESRPANRTESEEVVTFKDQAADIFRSLQDLQKRLAELEGLDKKGASAESAGD